MQLPRWTRRLLDSTRGQIILLLRQGPGTVTDLASALEVTDNAIRAHLVTLERDGLVHHTGARAGFRKPHFSYELTPEAADLFPKAYGTILNEVISVLKERMGLEETETVLREVGRRVAPPSDPVIDATLEERLAQAVKSLEKLGGLAKLSREEGGIFIRGAGCPLSAAATDHSEVCQMVETFLSEIIGLPVRQTCQREPSPQCCFQIGS